MSRLTVIQKNKEHVVTRDENDVVRTVSPAVFKLVKRNGFPEIRGKFASVMGQYQEGKLTAEELVATSALMMRLKDDV